MLLICGIRWTYLKSLSFFVLFVFFLLLLVQVWKKFNVFPLYHVIKGYWFFRSFKSWDRMIAPTLKSCGFVTVSLAKVVYEKLENRRPESWKGPWRRWNEIMDARLTNHREKLMCSQALWLQCSKAKPSHNIKNWDRFSERTMRLWGNIKPKKEEFGD